MTDLNIFSLKTWIKEYIILSNCFPTENTFRNFETKIKSLEMLLPVKPRREIYMHWHETTVIFNQKTPAQLRKYWNEQYPINNQMKEGLNLLHKFKSTPSGQIFCQWIIDTIVTGKQIGRAHV